MRIRRSDGDVWSVTGTAWENYSAGNVADYDIPLDDEGGGQYVGDFPNEIVAGNYVITLHDNATPADTDDVLSSEVMRWDGTDELLPATSEDTDAIITALSQVSNIYIDPNGGVYP